MKKQENKMESTICYTFTIDEVKKLKRFFWSGVTAFCFCLAAFLYGVFSVGTLQSENELYRNQLKMADEKMKELEDKTDTLEKMGNQLQKMMNENSGSAVSTTYGGGYGGASTVPDKARIVSEKESLNKGNIHEVSQKTNQSSTPGQILKEMYKLDTRLDTQIKLFFSLRDLCMTRLYGITGILSDDTDVLPNRWPVVGEISSGFGFRSSPGGIGSVYHEGVDIAGDYGMPIKATAEGIVTKSGWEDGYGYMVEIRHSNGIVTRYGHNSSNLVYEGQHVNMGEVVGLMGSTGNSTGPHCHYEVRINGDAVNPIYFLP